MSAEADDAREFAERVADLWWGQPIHGPELAALIASELRAGGWHKGEAPQGVDMAGATFT